MTSKGEKCLWRINNCTCYLISQHHTQKLHSPTPFSLTQCLAIRPANDYSSCSCSLNECHLANTKQAVIWHLSGGGLRPATLYLKGMMDGVLRRGQSLLYILSAAPLLLLLRCGFGSAIELWLKWHKLSTDVCRCTVFPTNYMYEAVYSTARVWCTCQLHFFNNRTKLKADPLTDLTNILRRGVLD